MEACHVLDGAQQPHRLKDPSFTGRGRFRLNAVQHPTRRGEDGKNTRRTHRKSRNGCQQCKLRRVKCDELQPVCSRCRTHHVWCRYEAPVDHAAQLSRPSQDTNSLSPDSIELALSLAHDNLGIQRLLESIDDSAAIQSQLRGMMTSNLEIFKHFSDFTYRSLPGKECQVVLKKHVLPYAATNPSLMHSLLALSARHLMHLQPDHRPHQLSHNFHMQRATSLLQAQLVGPIDTTNMDLIISNCFFINVVSIASDEVDPTESFVFKDDPNAIDDALRWLDMQGAVSGVFDIVSDMIWHSFWLPAFQEDGPEIHVSQIPERLALAGSSGIPTALASVCDITPISNTTNNPYHLALRHIASVTEANITTVDWKIFGNLACFITRMPVSYRDLLRRKDERALLLFAYWLTLIQHLDMWWVNGRARMECTAICLKLQKSMDKRIRKLARYPAIIQGCDHDVRATGVAIIDAGLSGKDQDNEQGDGDGYDTLTEEDILVDRLIKDHLGMNWNWRERLCGWLR